MDSEHRHELKESDLANFLASARKWWGRHQTKVLLLAIVLAAAILALRWSKQSSYASHERSWFELNTEVTAASLSKIADTASDPTIRTLAALRAGDELLAKAIRPSSTPETGATPEERSKALADAEALFKGVAKSGPAKDYVLNAQFRLATIAEQRGQWDAARQLYQTIQKDSGSGYERWAARAAGLEKSIDRIQTPPVFGPEPKPLDPIMTPGVNTPDPAKGDPGKEDPAKVDPAKVEPAKVDPAKVDPAKVDPAKVEPEKGTPAKTEPTKDAAPSKDVPAKTEPAKTEPSKTEPSKTEPAKDVAPEKDVAEKKAPTP
ncbi:MAG: hypothetical protein WD768_01375 [Phycisphaeraceae bacterium]